MTMDQNSSARKHKDPCLMKTHFLKPFVTSIDGLVADLPSNRPSVCSSDLKDSFSRIIFSGFLIPNTEFRSWARKMEALHEPIWRKAGIFEAIKASTYTIHKNQSLLLALVEKWCPETKSFVFPWGEATITLEDVMLLLGFSVLGSPVFAPLESSEMRDSVEKLQKVRAEIINRDSGVTQAKWVLSFRDRDDSLEHEAFLAMWLSHFVFPDRSRRSISRHVFPIAVRLARGERIAFAPAVLASIYRDLGQLQAFASDKSTQYLSLKSLFKLVQVWGWERFRNIRPRPRGIRQGEPRIAQWGCLNQRDDKVESLSFDDFVWRPYTKPLQNWNRPWFYPKKAMWMTVDDDLDDEFVSFARCVRSSPLVGVGFVEDYYPNRVAMQFGLSQDLPGLVTHHNNFTEKESWDDYNKSLDGLKLYIPCRLATTSVTARYRDWWLKSVSEFLSSKKPNETLNARNAVRDDASPEVLPLSQVLQKLGEGFPAKFKRSRKLRIPRHMGSETKKYKTGDCGASVSPEVPLSELAKRTRYRDWWAKSVPEATKTFDTRNPADFYDDDVPPKELSSRQVLEKSGGFLTKLTRCRKRRKAKHMESEIKKYKTGDYGASVSLEVPLSELFHKDLAKRTSEHLRNKRCKRAREDDDENPMDCHDDITIAQSIKSRKKTGGDESESLGKSRRRAEDNNDSGICQKLASEDYETVAPQEIEPRSEDNDEEEKCEAEEAVVLIPCDENNSSDPPLGGNVGVVDIVVSPPEARQNCGCDDEVDVNGIKAEKKTIVDDGTKEVHFLVHESGEMQRPNDNDDERSKLIKLDESETLGKRSNFEEDNNDSQICQKVASRDDETVIPQEIEQRREENDEEETGSKEEKIMVLVPSFGNNSSDPPPCSNEGVVDIVVSSAEARKNCGCDAELDVHGINTEKKITMVGDGTNKKVCLLHEDREKQDSNAKESDDDDDERLKQKKLAINELALNLEARMIKVENTMAKIREWKTRRNQIKTGVSALAYCV